MLFWCFSDAFLMRFWCISDAFLMNLMKQDSWAHGHGLVQSSNRPNEEEAEANRSQSKPIEEEAEANRSQSKKRPKRCVCCSPFTEKLASNFAVICEIDMWNRYVKSICEIDMWNRRQSPSSYAWLSEKGRQIPPPLLQSFYYIYYLQKWGLHNRSQIPSDSENRRQIV